MEKELIRTIKKGQIGYIDKTTNIFGEEDVVVLYKPVTYGYLKKFADANEISEEKLNEYIILYGKTNLVLDACKASKSFVEHMKNNRNVGKTGKTEEFSSDTGVRNLFNLDGVDEPQKNNTQTANDKKKISAKEKEQIEKDRKVMLSAIISDTNDVDKMVSYIDKFGLDKEISQIATDYVVGLCEEHSHTKTKRYGSKYRKDYKVFDLDINEFCVNGSIGYLYQKLYDAVFDEKNNPVYQMRLLKTIAVFDNKCFKEMYLNTFNNVANRYFDCLMNADLNSYNRKNYTTKCKGFVDVNFKTYFGFRDSNDEICLMSHEMEHVYEKVMFNLMLKGRVQEYLKREFVDGRNQVQESWRIYYLRHPREKVDWNAYYNSEAYKKLPVPKEALADGEEVKFKGKYPFFVVARNAMKRPNFDKKLLADPKLYEEGFNHPVFYEPYKLSKETLEKMKSNPLSFAKADGEILKEKQLYFMSNMGVKDKALGKGVFVMLDKRKRDPNALDLYVVATLTHDKNSINKWDLYLYNKGCLASDTIRERFFNGPASILENEDSTILKENEENIIKTPEKCDFDSMVDYGEYMCKTSEFDAISGYFLTKYCHEMTKDEFDNVMNKVDNEEDFDIVPVDEKQAIDYEKYMHELKQNEDAYESMTGCDWSQLDDVNCK